MAYRHIHPNREFPKNMLFFKNPQFLHNLYETWSKSGILKLFISTKFLDDCVKIVDFK